MRRHFWTKCYSYGPFLENSLVAFGTNIEYLIKKQFLYLIPNTALITTSDKYWKVFLTKVSVQYSRAKSPRGPQKSLLPDFNS